MALDAFDKLRWPVTVNNIATTDKPQSRLKGKG